MRYLSAELRELAAMKSFFKITCVAVVLAMALPAMAKLRGYPGMESIGLVDENPLHIAAVFDNGRITLQNMLQ